MDIKYAYYNSSKGYKVVGGTANQFLKADGSTDNRTFVTINTAEDILAIKEFKAGLGILYGQRIYLKGTNDQAHYVGCFSDDTDGFAVSTGFSVKGYNSLDSNWFFVNSSGAYVNGNQVWHSGNLPTSSFHKIDAAGGINNGSDNRANQTFFDYNWADKGVAGSVINFSGLNPSYSGELFIQYNDKGNYVGVRSHNGDLNKWNNPKWLWHSDQFSQSDVDGWKSMVVNQNNFVTTNTVQMILSNKVFSGSTSNGYTGAAIMINGDGANNTIYPTLAFHQPTQYAGTISYRGNGFHFMDINGKGYEYIKAFGFQKNGSDDTYVLLGGGGHRLADDFIDKTSGQGNITGIKRFSNPGNGINYALEVYSNTTMKPGIFFHHSGLHTAVMVLESAKNFAFYNNTQTQLLGLKVDNVMAKSGFIHMDYNDPNKLLASDGSVFEVSNFVTTNTNQNISATKTFTQSPIIPSATLGNHAVNLSQLNNVAAGFITVNEPFSASALMMADMYNGEAEGLFDKHYNMHIAGKEGNMIKLGSHYNGSGGVVINMDTAHMGYGGVSPTPSHNHYFNGTIRIAYGIDSESSSGSDVFGGNGSLYNLPYEVALEDGNIRFRPDDSELLGTYNLYNSKSRIVKLTLPDGGEIVMDEMLKFQEVTIMNIGKNKATFIVKDMGYKFPIEPRSSAKYYMNGNGRIIQESMSVGNCFSY